jgi:hypothetical protein
MSNAGRGLRWADPPSGVFYKMSEGYIFSELIVNWDKLKKK